MLNARQITEWRCQMFFRAGEIFWNKDTSIRISTTIHETKVLQGKMSEIFVLFYIFIKRQEKLHLQTATKYLRLALVFV